MLAIALGMIMIGLGIKAMTPAGIPFTRQTQLKGLWAKAAGGFCIVLGLVAIGDGVWFTFELGKKIAAKASQDKPETPPAPVGPAEESQKPTANSQDQAAAKWNRFVSACAGFSVLLPGTPSDDDTGPNPQIGKTAGRMFQLEDGDRFYQVVFTQFVKRSRDQQAEFDAGRDSMLRGMGGKAKTERDLTMAGFPSKEIVFVVPSGEVIRVAIIIADNSVYQVWASGPKGFVESDLIDAYFNSFELNTPAEASEPAATSPEPAAPSD